MSVGEVVLTFDSSPSVVLRPARVRSATADYDRRLHRAPYGSTVFSSGTGQREAAVVTVEVEVQRDSIALAGADAREVITLLNTATAVNAAGFGFYPAGVVSSSVQPMVLGYRVEVSVLAASTVVYAPGAVTFDGEPVEFDGQPLVWFGGA